ncbi:hypothetical protein Tco_0183325 [Tanacetum coccineum]
MHPGKIQTKHIDEFHKMVGDLAAIDTAISDKDQALLLLTSLPSSYDNFVETLLFGRDTMKLEDVVATLNSKELQKMTEAKGDGDEGFYVRGRSGQRDMEQGTYSAWPKSHGRSSRLGCYVCQSEEHLKRDFPMYNHKKSQGFVRNKDQVSGSGADGYDTVNEMPCMRDRYVPELRRNLISLGTRRANCVYTLDGQAVTRKTLKGRKQLGEYQTGWKIKTGLQQQNGLVKETNVTLLAKVVLYMNMGFNESEEYKKTCIGSSVDTGSVHVLQEVEFEVEPQEDHTFEVEPHRNVDHELFSYRKDSNEAAFAVAAMEKIYAHESLTFNNTVACEVISKWKAGLKDDMDARSDVYVLSNGCKKCSDDW